jgi:hypothetical protein
MEESEVTDTYSLEMEADLYDHSGQPGTRDGYEYK